MIGSLDAWLPLVDSFRWWMAPVANDGWIHQGAMTPLAVVAAV